MNHLIIFLLIPLSLIASDDSIPENYTFYENICIRDICNIEFYFVNSWVDFPPNVCKHPDVKGCAVYGENNFIYLRAYNGLDEFGFTVFEHEALHVLCQCDFHTSQELREFIRTEENAFDIIIQYKEDIQEYNKQSMPLIRL